MGFKNVPMIFQRVMNKILGNMIGKGVEVYMDDIVIHAKEHKVNDKLLDEVLRKLRENNLKVSKNKI